uniref:T9SS type B sorting domain-containing protein n=1 Tax=uncultured Draconibacterium sp. TaxID=1573823 RepID=UPI0025DD8AFB
LTVLKTAEGTDDVTICESELPYTWIDGNEYNESTSGVVTDTLTGQAANTCDSIVTLNLTVLKTAEGTDDVTICESELPYTWIDGNEYTESTSGVVTDTLTGQAANTCDSIVTLNLTVLKTAYGTDVQTACDSYTWIDGNTYTESNNSATYTMVGGAASGCDSIVTLDLTINETAYGTDVQTACDSYTWIDGNTYTESNSTATYTIEGGAASGCDSIVTLDLTINPSYSFTENHTMCEGETYNWHRTQYSQAGTYTAAYETVNGCDSIYTLNLRTLQNGAQTLNITECDSYTLNGVTYDESGRYTQTVENANGCTLTITLNLTISGATYGTDTQTACSEFTWIDGNTYTEDNNTATYTTTNAAGCDSIVTLNLTILDPLELTSEASDLTVESDGLGNTAELENWLLSNGTTGNAEVAVGEITWTNNFESLTSACGNTGEATVTFTATDDCGNTVSTAATFKVVDTTIPEISCNDITVQLDANGVATISADDLIGSIDNAGIDTVFIDNAEFYCGNIGENAVTLTAIDECGNVATCTATVTVEQGASDCGINPLRASADILDVVICPGNNILWNPNILSNDEGIGSAGVTITIDSVPSTLTIDLESGDLDFFTDNYEDFLVEIPYTICSNADPDNCSSSTITIIVQLDSDCDGVPNSIDIDDDNDGILDIHEQDANKSVTLEDDDIDTDGDGIVDRLDLDSDGDGIPDNIEWQQTIAEAVNHDDYVGLEYYEPLGTDSDGDGWDDRYDDNEENIYYTAFDTDGDGTPDYLDLDADGDDIDDIIEGNDANLDGVADNQPTGQDSDKDGIDDAFDTFDNWFVKKDKYRNTVSSNVALQDEDSDGRRDWRQVQDVVVPPITPPAALTLVIPEGFSPNTDNKNDYFEIQMSVDDVDNSIFGEEYPDAHLYVYNRWGNLIFEKEHYGNYSVWGTNKAEAWWDGRSESSLTIGSGKVPPATYIYILQLDNQTVEKGTIFINY